MPFADIHGQRIYYEDSGGSGPPVVFCHGFLMDHRMFDPQVEALAPAYRAIRWDARGFGRTETDGKPFTYYDSAADCIALMDHLGVDKAVLVGMSQGGFLALRAALRYPDRVKGLVLIDTEAGVPDAQTMAGYQQMLETWTTQGPIQPLVETLAGMILGDRQHWEPWVSRWQENPKEQIVEPSNTLLGRDDITEHVGEITCPALVVHGTADAAIPLETGRALAQALPRCAGFVAVEGAAHAPNVTHPAQVNPALRAFLDTHA